MDYIALGPCADAYGEVGEMADPEKLKKSREHLDWAMGITAEDHFSFLSNGIWVLEAFNLEGVRPGPCISGLFTHEDSRR